MTFKPKSGKDLLVEKVLGFRGHREPVFSIDNINEREFVSSGSDGWIAKWDRNKTDEGELLAKCEGSVYALKLNGDNLLIAENQFGLRKLDLKSKQEVKAVKLDETAYFDVKVEGDEIWLISELGKVYILDLELNLKKIIKLSDRPLRCLDFIKEANETVIGSSDGYLYFLDKNENYTLKKKVYAHESSVFCVCVLDQRRMLSGGRDAKLKLWDTKMYKELLDVPAHLFTINAIEKSPDGKYFATASQDKTIKIWYEEDMRLLKVIDKPRHGGHSSSVNRIKWLSGNEFISCSDDREVILWKIDLEYSN